jgi:hypothetical protein
VRTQDEAFDLMVRNDILDVAQMLPALRARLRPGRGSSESGRTAPESRPPIDLHISDLIAAVAWDAEHFAHVLLDETHGDGRYKPTGTTTEAFLRDIAGRVGHWTQDPDRMTVLDFADTWHEQRRKVSGAIASRERPRWLGPCTKTECAGDLYLSRGKVDPVCRECKVEVSREEISDHLAAAFETRLMTQGELLSALHVLGLTTKQSTLGMWVVRERLVPVVVDPKLFQFKDALALAQRGKVAS